MALFWLLLLVFSAFVCSLESALAGGNSKIPEGRGWGSPKPVASIGVPNSPKHFPQNFNIYKINRWYNGKDNSPV